MSLARTVGTHRIIAVVTILVAAFSSILRNRANLSLTSKSGGPVNKAARTSPTEYTHQNQTGTLPTQSSFLFAKTSSDFRPTTKVDRECTPVSSQPLRKMNSFPEYQDPSIFQLSIEDHEELAVCELPLQQGTSTHLPHVMQIIYACFSYWQEYSSRQPILLTSMPSEAVLSKLNRIPFLNGFLVVMRTKLGLKLMSRDELDTWVNETQNDGVHGKNRYTVKSFDIRGGFVLSNAQNLSDLVRAELQIPSQQVVRGENPTLFCPELKPKIGILNRKKNVGRSISNVELVVHGISNLTDNVVSLSPVEYFEGRSFRDQVEFFSNIDILVSPHGAQLTGIPFMANKPCSQLLELFPKGYSIPTFFGSLALNAEVSYSYMYLSDRSEAAEQAQGLRERISARATNLCPNPALIVNAVQSIVKDWCDCQQQYLH